MKDFTMFNYDYLFSDHFASVSDQAKLLYIKMNFYANNGFVANPISICDSMGYDKSILLELINNEDILKLDDRNEVFITSYFIHNKGIKSNSWWNSPFSIYWKGKLFVKANGIVTLKKIEEDSNAIEIIDDTTKAISKDQLQGLTLEDLSAAYEHKLKRENGELEDE